MSRVIINDTTIRTVQVGGIQGPAGPTGPTGPTGPAGADGTNGVGLPAGGTVGQVPTKASATDYDVTWSTSPAGVMETISGGAGFASVSGTVALDLSAARSFHQTMTGNITGLSFTNVPTDTQYSATWTWVLAINPTGGYTLSGTPTVTWVDGSDWSDIVLTANAINVVTFWRIGSVTYATLVWNGALYPDPYTLSFAADGSQLVAITRTEVLGLDVVTHIEEDGTAGTGTLTYDRNGTPVSGPHAFTAGQVLKVTLTGSTAPSAVSIPRTL